MKKFTKSLFKLGLECPNKLYFTKKKEYANAKLEDPFLEALAKGGFQVEALARWGYPNGKFIDTENYEYDKAVNLTKEAFEQENATLFEAGFAFGDLFVRTDIVEKKGNVVRLIEVKAKSFDSTDKHIFIGKKGGIVAGWKPYLFDLAFQKYVAQKQYPHLKIVAYLCMVDKNKKATIDGLNQSFRIPKNGDVRKEIIQTIDNIENIDILSEVSEVDEIINSILRNEFRYLEHFDVFSFEEMVDMLASAYQEDKYLNYPVKFSTCKQCEFKTDDKQKQQGLLSGFEKCFKNQLNWRDEDFNKPNAMEIWNFRGESLIQEKRLLMEQLSEDDFKIKPEAGKMSSSERQWIQVEKAVNNDNSIYLLSEELKSEMSRWKFPLHFIDFETSAVALPFNKGRAPYEQIAFQFSEHIYNEDDTIEHHSQYINNEAGVFPNFEFARALKKSLEKDNGSIFRFATHENSIINAIISQLEESNEADKEELIVFLKSISHSKSQNIQQWCGERDMIDLCEIVKKYYYNPLTKGSNSIKAVLPAVINSSEHIQGKYSKPIGEIGVSSKNFPENHIWLTKENDIYANPYKNLPSLFNNMTEEELDELVSDLDDVNNGGAALTAYAQLQYVEMKQTEREELTQALLRYCELDTLAMVMVYEHFLELTNKK